MQKYYIRDAAFHVAWEEWEVDEGGEPLVSRLGWCELYLDWQEADSAGEAAAGWVAFQVEDGTDFVGEDVHLEVYGEDGELVGVFVASDCNDELRFEIKEAV